MDISVNGQGRQNVHDYVDNSVEKQNYTDINTKQTYDSKNADKESKPVSVEEAEKAVDKLNKLLEDKSTHIEYEQDENFKQVMIMKVIDNDTNKVVNEIPSKKILDMVAQFCEMAGLLLDKKA